MRIVVTGALGHIGSALIRDPALVAAAKEIILVDNLATQRFGSLFDLPHETKYTLLPFDVEVALTRRLVADVDAVIHLAAISDPAASMEDPAWLFENNLRITRHVIDTCLESRTPLIFVSSTSVYTATTSRVDEDSSTADPTTPYARCKLQEESLVLAAVERGLPAIIFRLGTIFGVSPGMRFHTAVNKFCWHAATGQVIDVWRTALHQRRPYLDLSDACSVLVKTLNGRLFPGLIVNAVTVDSTVSEVLTAIRDCGVATRVRLIESQLMNDLSYETCTLRAQSFGFQFNGSMERQIAVTLRTLGRLNPRLQP